MQRIVDIVAELTGLLQTVSNTAKLDAELILAEAINQRRDYLYSYPNETISNQAYALLQDYLARRQQGEPLAYITGHQEFWSLDLYVSKNTLIPRPETEHLVEWLLEHLPTEPLCIADLGTGSGAIAIALAHERPQWTIHATDCCAKALRVAKRNADRHALDNIEFYWGSWCDALPPQKYAAIVSNPPYIAAADPHLQQLKNEPQHALVSGDDGLHAITSLANSIGDYLQDEGIFIFEHGHDQAADIIALLDALPFHVIRTHQDMAKQDRFTTCYFNPAAVAV